MTSILISLRRPPFSLVFSRPEGWGRTSSKPSKPSTGRFRRMLVDSHAHLTDEDYKDDLAAVAERWRRAGVGLVVTVGTDLEDSRRAVELAAGLADVRATVGLHPNEARKWHDGSFEQFKTLARHPRVVAIGETGLDHHYAPTPGDREFQAVVFREHIRLARETGLPLM